MTTTQRLSLMLASAGVPADRLSVNKTARTATIDSYTRTPTQTEIDTGNAIIATFDWSTDADAAWVQAQTREQAKAAITGISPELIATRAACYALMVSLQETRAKLNELIAAIGANVAPLVTGESFADAMATVSQVIDSGAV